MEFKTTAALLFVILVVLVNEGAGVPVPEESSVTTISTTTETEGPKLCSRVTPCKWGVYDKDSTKRINLHIENPTCICGPERRCAINEDNLSKGAFIFRCISTATTTPSYYGSKK